MAVKTRAKSKRRYAINSELMTKIEPLTPNQKVLFKEWDKGKHLFVYGSAGTGKTFCALYKALQDCLKSTPNYDHVYLVRSLVSTREIGFLPGDHAFGFLHIIYLQKCLIAASKGFWLFPGILAGVVGPRVRRAPLKEQSYF